MFGNLLNMTYCKGNMSFLHGEDFPDPRPWLFSLACRKWWGSLTLCWTNQERKQNTAWKTHLIHIWYVCTFCSDISSGIKLSYSSFLGFEIKSCLYVLWFILLKNVLTVHISIVNVNCPSLKLKVLLFRAVILYFCHLVEDTVWKRTC